MGRYYSGDIEGKFWFGVQSSTDADFFGGERQEPNYVDYYFEKGNDLLKITIGVLECRRQLGEYKDKIDEFFKNNNGYTDERIAEYLKVDVVKVKELLTWYARLRLGEKIQKCVEETGSCSFQAEL